MSGNSYELKEFQDFMRIPPDKIDACLDDLKRVFKYHHAFCELLGAPAISVPLKNLVWTDDDSDEVRCTLQFPDDESLTLKVHDSGMAKG